MDTIYKIRLYPNQQQIEYFNKTLGACRWVYNYFLEQKKRAYKQTQKNYGLANCDADLSKKRQEFSWLSAIDVYALQSAIRHVDADFRQFIRDNKQHKTAEMPHYLSKQSYNYGFNTKVKIIDNRHIKIPKLSIIKCSMSQKIQGKIIYGTIIQVHDGQYDLLLKCTDIPVVPLPKTQQTIIIDNDNLNLFTEEDQVFFQRNEEMLRRLEKRLTKQAYGSRNYLKTRQRIHKHYEKFKNRLNDIIHKYTTDIIKKYDVIIITELANTEVYAKIVSQMFYKAGKYDKTVVIQKSPLPT